VAQLFTRLSADIATSDARQLAVVLERAALQLEPENDRARLLLASALAEGDSRHALRELAAIRTDGAIGPQAAALRVTILSDVGETAGALKAATALAAAPTATSADLQRQGDLLVAAGRFEEAAAAYDKAIARAGDDAGWVLYLQRGGALEQAGRWPEARVLLQRAVALAPDETVALNYLGYAQVTRGENVAAARAMLERAARLKPEDANIADSLGWAYVHAGDLARGVPLIERAARAEPANAEIQEHLGDAYWRLGRRYEARYAWRAAQQSAGGREASRLAAKLVTGPAD
jgi:Flp pilus assembly protein TadD